MKDSSKSNKIFSRLGILYLICFIPFYYKEVEKERRKFVYGTYIISTINVLLTLIVAFYLVKNDQFVDNAVKYTVIIFFPYLLSLYFTKKYTIKS